MHDITALSAFVSILTSEHIDCRSQLNNFYGIRRAIIHWQCAHAMALSRPRSGTNVYNEFLTVSGSLKQAYIVHLRRFLSDISPHLPELLLYSLARLLTYTQPLRMHNLRRISCSPIPFLVLDPLVLLRTSSDEGGDAPLTPLYFLWTLNYHSKSSLGTRL